MSDTLTDPDQGAKSRANATTKPAETDKESVDREFGDIKKNFGDTTEHPTNDNLPDGGEAQADDDEKDSDDDENLYNDDEHEEGKKKKSFVRRHKKMLLGGGFGSVGIVIILLVLLGLLSSLKYVQFATVLRSYEFARFNQMIRRSTSQTMFDAAVLDKNSDGSFQLNLLGGRSLLDIARRINPQKQLEELGRGGKVTFSFRKDTGFLGGGSSNFEGVTIDGNHYSLNTTTSQLYGKAEYNDLPARDRLRVRNFISQSISIGLDHDLQLQSRAMIGALKGIQGAFGFQLVGWVNKARGYVGMKIKPSEIKNLKDGRAAAFIGPAPAPQSLNDQANADAEAVNAEIEADLNKSTVPDVPTIVANNAAPKKLTQAAGQLKKYATITLLATGYCVLRDLLNSSSQIDKANAIHATNGAMLVQSRANQVSYGDSVGEAVGGASATIDGFEKSGLYQIANGQPLTSQGAASLDSVPTLDNSSIINSGPVTTAYNVLKNIFDPLSFIPVIGKALGDGECTVLLSPEFQITSSAFELFADIGSGGADAAATDSLLKAFQTGLTRSFTTGSGAAQFVKKGAGFAASYEAFSAVGDWMQSFVAKISGAEFSGVATGTAGANESVVGTDYAAESVMRTSGFGRPLNDTEAAATQTNAVQDTKAAYNTNFTQRYFALSNPYSLLSSILPNIPSSLGDIGTSLRGALPSLVQKLDSLFVRPTAVLSALFGNAKATFAVSDQDILAEYNHFGVQQWGWSLAEWKTVNTDTAYTLENNTTYVEQNYDRLDAAYAQCFQSAYQYIPNDPSTTPAACTSAYLSTSDALHYRWYRLQRKILTNATGSAIPS